MRLNFKFILVEKYTPLFVATLFAVLALSLAPNVVNGQKKPTKHKKAVLRKMPINLNAIDLGKKLDFSGDTIFQKGEDKRTGNNREEADEVFRDTCKFEKSIFIDSIDFSESSFLKKAFFGGAHFSGHAAFPLASFSDWPEFQDVLFEKDCDFSDGSFEKGGVFKSATFRGSADFSDTEFGESIFFNTADFVKGVSFESADFRKGGIFMETRFNGSVCFSKMKLSENSLLNFENSVLPDTLDFSENTKISAEIDLTKANFVDSTRYNSKTEEYKPHWIYLYKSDVSKIRLDYTHFRLLLPDSTLGSINGRRRSISRDEKEAVYEAVLNNFKIRGEEESFKRLDIEYQDFKYDENWYTKFLSVVNRMWWNYGYSKGLVFMWAGIFVVLFTFINYFQLGFLNSEVYKMENVPAIEKITTIRGRIWYSLVYTSSIFFRITLKLEKLTFTRRLATVYIIVLYTFGVICLAYMANFVLQK